MGPWDGSWWVPGIAPLPAHPGTHYPGYTSPLPHAASALYCCRTGHARGLNSVVGLISVGQLSLVDRFSDIRGMTEVYNAKNVGRINNHYVIPGND